MILVCHSHFYALTILNPLVGHSKFVIKLQNGEPSERYWLSLFREWLRDLQEKLDDAERKGLLKNYDKNNSTKTSDIDLAISLTCSYGQHYNCSRVFSSIIHSYV